MIQKMWLLLHFVLSSSRSYFVRYMPAPESQISETTGEEPDIPEEVQIGDFIVGRYTASEWSRYFPWENWDHAALVTGVDPLTIIEASGIILQRRGKETGKEEIREGVVEYEFLRQRTVKNLDGSKNPDGNLWLKDDLIEALWLQPVFPDPLREIAHWKVPWRKRGRITETQARQRAVAFARSQIGEPFSISLKAHKWNTQRWYCSLLIFKAYSRTVTNIYLESYEPAAGWYVTPEDLSQSRRSTAYHHWVNGNSAS